MFLISVELIFFLVLEAIELNLSDDLNFSDVYVPQEQEESAEVFLTAEDLRRLPPLATSVRSLQSYLFLRSSN